MDPDETLRQLRLTIKQMAVEEKGGVLWTAHAAEVVEYVEALDGWLSAGGFVPADWKARS